MKLLLGAAIGVAALVAALGAHGAARPFQPQWLAPVSASEFWLGGSGTVLHTFDRGRHLSRLPAPPASSAVRFANSRDGFAYSWHAPLYTTHDGGRSWHRAAPRGVLAFAASGGTAYAVTGRCAEDGTCLEIRLERSPVSRNAWLSSPMPFAQPQPNFNLAAWHSNVWLFGGSASGRYQLTDLLARSTNGGRTFLTRTIECYAELGAELEPVSSRVVWAFCPTGLQGVASRSSDGGATFKPLHIPRCCPNSTSLGPVTETIAVVSANAGGSHLLRTTDGGATWRPARTPSNVVDWGSFFFDHSSGFALASVTRTGRIELLGTADAGASWHRIPIR
jgi:hypothetical protein